MRATWALAALACLGWFAATPAPAAAQTRTITCESRADERKDCYVGNLDVNSVSLDKKLSKSPCTKGTSWGTSKDNIWVSQGCRANFSYRTRSGQGGGGFGGSGTSGSITCESRGNERKECYVQGLDRSTVTMDRKLSDSPCISGQSWGTGGDIIWVSNGCRAIFGYVTRSGGGGNGGWGGNGTSGTLTCESRGNERKECYVAGLDRSSVRLNQRLSSSPCNEGQSWGTSGDYIWVSNGCRAVFNYVSRSGGAGGQAPGNAYDATGRVRCWMRVGGPQSQCHFGVNRRGNGSGTVTVTRPDGRKRTIYFERGTATGYDQSQADSQKFRWDRADDETTVQIGEEGYVIPDAVIYGG